jgi:anti-sigma factor RsiW
MQSAWNSARPADKQRMGSLSRCPPADIADEYVLGRLPPAHAARFRLHLRRCLRCARAVQFARTLVRALHAAARGSPSMRT